MITALRLAGIGILALLVCFTGAKLVKMSQIRGFVRGPIPESKTITDKAVLAGSYGDSYWLAWDGVDINIPSRDRINLSKDVWEEYRVGDRIEVFYFPGDKWPYHKKDIFADDGNFAFDAALLLAWLSGLTVLVVFQMGHVLRNRRQTPPPLPGA